MKVYISDTSNDSLVVKLVKGLGHEVILPNNSDDGKVNEGSSKRGILDADAAVFPLETRDRMGIMDHLSAYSLGIPCITLRRRLEGASGLSPNIEIMSKIVNFSSPEELENELRGFFDETRKKPELNTGSPYKERV